MIAVLGTLAWSAPVVVVHTRTIENTSSIPNATNACFSTTARWSRSRGTDPALDVAFMDHGALSCMPKDGRLDVLVCFDPDVDEGAIPDEASCSVGGHVQQVRIRVVSADPGPLRQWTPGD